MSAPVRLATKQGRFKDIQTYQCAHGADLRRKAKKEK